eukprot:IDg11817t1
MPPVPVTVIRSAFELNSNSTGVRASISSSGGGGGCLKLRKAGDAANLGGAGLLAASLLVLRLRVDLESLSIPDIKFSCRK